MLFTILLTAGLLLFVLIRRYIRETSRYEVINQEGFSSYYGSFAECTKVAKEKNIEAEAYDEDDRFTVKRSNRNKWNMEILYPQ